MPPPMMAARRPTAHHLLEWRIWLAFSVDLRWEPLFLGIHILFLHTGITLSFLTGGYSSVYLVQIKFAILGKKESGYTLSVYPLRYCPAYCCASRRCKRLMARLKRLRAMVILGLAESLWLIVPSDSEAFPSSPRWRRIT